MRGFLSPRRSKPGTITKPEEKGSDEKETHLKTNHRSSSTSSLNPSKSTTKHQPQINNSILSSKSAPESSFTSPASSARTTKSAAQPTTSKKNGKGGTASRAKATVTKDNNVSHKYFDSPNASPTHFPTSVKVADSVLHTQLQHRLAVDDGRDDVANNVLHTNSINDSVGSDTKEQYDSESNTPTILFKIYEEIASHRKGNTSIKSYFRNLKALWDEPAPIFSELPQSSSNNAIVEQSVLMEREKLMQFLLGINVSYSSLCSNILLLNPSPTVDEAYSLILQEQRSRKLGKKNSM